MEMDELITTPTGALEALNRSEIDQQVATAKRYPRSVQTFRTQAMSTVSTDVQIAQECVYKIPREGKLIEGPSIRLAEICMSAYGNIRCGSRIVGQDDEFVTAQGAAHDLEKNVYVTSEIRRRITDKTGRRYSQDMIALTGNAACAIALRNAIFKIIPQVYVRQLEDAAKKCAVGDQSTLPERRQAALVYFKQQGITKEQILQKVGKPSIEDIGLGELDVLLGIVTAIKDGEITLDEAFRVEAANDSEQPKTPGDQLLDNVRKRRGRPPKPQPQRDPGEEG